ncbi:MAG: NAD-dependent epimerase/dehydratase family protein [Pirellulales bacterium]|nr:NAD-dependent epimerase/dehydratase family protein [Pirellulales bacterium]
MSQGECEHDKQGQGQVALVTGGTGAVGPSVVRCLLQAGYDVRMLIWGKMSMNIIPAGATAFAGDINDRDSLKEPMRGTDLVCHLAAKLHINNPDPSLRREYWRVNVDGTRCVAEEAAVAGVKRFVHFSTINVYGTSTFPNVFDETSPLNCDSLYTQTKSESEQIVLNQLPATVLRMAAVYGPRMKGNYARLLNALRKGCYLPIGTGQNRRTLVHQEDVAQAVLLAAAHPQAVNQTYNVSDGEIHTLDEIVTAMCNALGRRPPKMRIPITLAKMGAAAVDTGMFCIRRRPFARTLLTKLLDDMAVDGSRIQSELGYMPRYDLQSGWNTLT